MITTICRMNVINDEFIRLNEGTRNIAIWVFTFFLVAAGVIDGLWNGMRYLDQKE